MSLIRIREILLADTTLQTMVGNRIYTGYAIKEARAPFILLDETTITANPCKSGTSDLDNYSFGVSAIALRYEEVENILQRVRQILEGFSDDIFGGIFFEGIEDIYDGTQDYFIKSHNYTSLNSTV